MANISLPVKGVKYQKCNIGGYNAVICCIELDGVFSNGNTYTFDDFTFQLQASALITKQNDLINSPLEIGNNIFYNFIDTDGNESLASVNRYHKISFRTAYNKNEISSAGANYSKEAGIINVLMDGEGNFTHPQPVWIYATSNIDFTIADATSSKFGYLVYPDFTTDINFKGYYYDAGANNTYKSIFTPWITPSDDPYADLGGEDDIPGGGTVAIPGFPNLTATSTGIVGLFAPSAEKMRMLADFMWTDFGGEGTDVVSVLKEIVEAIKRSISNPLDYVIGLNIIPSQGLSIGTESEIKFGFVSSGVSMPRLTNQYFTVDCGSIYFPYVCGDTFLDYAPYSKFSIYLPYIGVKEVDANDFVGHTIGVIYHGDTVTGGVTAYITKDGSVMYQYSGCCALNIPLSADNWGNTISSAVQIATSLVAGAATGGAAGVVSAAAKGAASVAANPSLLSPQVSHSGAVSGGAGCMAVQYPFVIRESVRFHTTEYFNTISGYPSYYYRLLGNVVGYTSVVDVHLEGIPATRDEIDEIENLLKGGVIL